MLNALARGVSKRLESEEVAADAIFLHLPNGSAVKLGEDWEVWLGEEKEKFWESE